MSVFSEPMSAAPSRVVSSSNQSSNNAKEDCPRCHGMRSSDAWDVVGVMKMESAALKKRVSQLEHAQDDALDFLNGLNLVT